MWIMSEIIIGLTILAVICVAVARQSASCLWCTAIAGLVGALVMALYAPYEYGTGPMTSLVYPLRICIMAISLIIGLAVRPWLCSQKNEATGFLVLWLGCTGGMSVLISAHDLISLYMALELTALPMVVLIALNRDKFAVRCAWRYFIMSALGTSIWLMGMVLLYGVTGTMDLAQMTQIVDKQIFPLMSPEIAATWLFIAAVCMMAGFAVKFGLCPMQRWVVDVYERAPWPSLMVVSALPKLAIWVVLVRVMAATGQPVVWQLLGWIIGLGSLVYGTLMALSTRAIRSLLAYASIAQLGVVMLVSVIGSPDSMTASALFMTVYVVMGVLVMGVLFNIEKDGREVVSWDELRGLSVHHPAMSMMIAMLMFAMAGIPPMLGFIAKFDMIRALVKAQWWLSAGCVVLMSVVALAYYTRLIKATYFEAPLGRVNIISGRVHRLWVGICVVFVVWGLYPAPVVNFIDRWVS